MAFLQLTNVQKAFGQTVAVRDVNLQVARGEFVSFLGPSGCGKTTTLRMIAGFEHPTSGSIVIDGVEVTGTPANQRNIGMVFQSYALFPNMTVANNIGFGLKVAGKSAQEIKTRVDEMLGLIKLETLGNRYPYQLSGGQQQRVALARALAIRPQLLLLDEPLSALDAKIRVSLRNEIRAIQRKLGITTIYVTHDQEEALSLSDRVVVMNEGRMEQIGAPFEIYNFPQTAFVAGCRIVKLFPSELLGPRYIKAIRAPLDDIEIMPTGGISAENIGEYVKAGIVGAGIGSALVTGPSQDLHDLAKRAQALRQAWDAAVRK